MLQENHTHRLCFVTPFHLKETVLTPETSSDACVDFARLSSHAIWNCRFRNIRVSAPTSCDSHPHSWNYLPRPWAIDLYIHVQQLHRQADVEWLAVP